MASRVAIVRGVPNSFCDALSLTPPPQPVNLDRARLQHKAYVNILKELVQKVIEVPADDKYPDCPFIEDTAVVIGNKAFITHPGAASRQGEEVAVRKALQQLGVEISEVESSGTIDGGDVLYASGMLFVGKSSRTDAAGIDSLQKAFPDVKVHTIPVAEGLHLKSAISMIAPQTLAVEDSVAAMAMFDEIQRKTGDHFTMVKTKGPGAANTLLVGNTVVCSATLGLGAGDLKGHYEQHVEHVVPADISEFHKMDGGLTCLSLLIER